MPRIARIVVPGYAYHVTQRGNYRQKIFRNDEDHLKYLSWIAEYSSKYHLSIWAYCLMDNHVHFVVQPQKEESLAKVFSVVHMRYSQYFNKEYIDSEENAEEVEAIRKYTMVGRPLGEEGFIKKLSKNLGRAVTILPRGRPKKIFNSV